MEPTICLHCRHFFEAQYRQTLLGFRVYTCPACGKPSIYPLPMLYRRAYWGVMLFVGGVLAINYFMNARLQLHVFFAILFIAGIIALLRDIWIQRRADAAYRAYQQSRQQAPNSTSE